MSISVSGSQITFNDASTQTTAAAGFGFKNRIINGAMMIDQRNAGAAQTVTTAGTAYTLDRWALYTAGANITSQRVSASAVGYQYGWQITGATSNTVVVAGQRIESSNCWDLAGQSITVSFKVYNSGSSTTMTIEPAYPNAIDNFSAVTYFSSTTVTIPNGWSTQTYTFTANANCINGLVIYHNFGALTAGVTRIITGYQLEKGSTATSFDYRPYGTELQLCQRYYYRIGGNESNELMANGLFQSSTNAEFVVNMPVTMRAIPTASYSGTLSNFRVSSSATFTPTTLTFDIYGVNTLRASTTVSGATAGYGAYLRSSTSTAQTINISAEL